MFAGDDFKCLEGKQNLDYWDITKEYMMTNQNVTYHVYLSKDKKESWIFKADVAKDKKNVNVVIPDKIENAPVVSAWIYLRIL